MPPVPSGACAVAFDVAARAFRSLLTYMQCAVDGCNSAALPQPAQCAAAVTADLLTQRNLSFPETATVTSFALAMSCENCANLGACPTKPLGAQDSMRVRPASTRLLYDCVEGGSTVNGLVLLLDYPSPGQWAQGITGGLSVTYCKEQWSTLFWVVISISGFCVALALCCWKSGLIAEHLRHKREDAEKEAARLAAAAAPSGKIPQTPV